MVLQNGKGHFTGTGECGRDHRKLDHPFVSCLVERGTLKAIQFLHRVSTEAKFALIKDLLLKRPSSKILPKRAFTDH